MASAVIQRATAAETTLERNIYTFSSIISTFSADITRTMIGNSDFVGVRRLDAASGAWVRGAHDPVGIAGDNPIQLPAEVTEAIRLRKPMLIQRAELSAEKYSSLLRSLPFEPDQLIVAPISSREQVGFLEIAHRGSKELAKDVTGIAGSLARLIGLYNELLSHIALLREANQTLADSGKQQTEAFMDLEHQIRAPLRHASWRVQGLRKLARVIEPGSPALVKEIEYLQGILRRAQRVAGNLRLFTLLESNKPIIPDIRPYRIDFIRGILIAAAMDHQLYAECAHLTVTFDVVRTAVETAARDLRGQPVYLDQQLLEQALDDLLDNASKYSFQGERVRIEVNVSKVYFVISVFNRGLRIERGQIAVIVKRGERGPLAQHTVGEGSGIGLWIVDEIMKAHNGKLDVQPTNFDGENCIRLMIPLGKPHI